jgi:hypothetical protein
MILTLSQLMFYGSYVNNRCLSFTKRMLLFLGRMSNTRPTHVKRFLDNFNSYASAARNAAWIVGVVLAVASFVWALSTADKIWKILTTCVCLALLYALIRAHSYRRRLKMTQKGFRYIHRLTHQLRNAFDESPLVAVVAEEGAAGLAEPLNAVRVEELQMMTLLQQILDNTAHCFREITGHSCTTSLILPGRSDSDGDYLQSVLYCSDADPERTQSPPKQRGGLCHMAFNAGAPMLFNDYEQEMKKGNFIVFRSDWGRWYLSGYMAHFKVDGERWGLLNIDSPRRNAFHDNQAELVAAFADACGLVFNLCDK